MTPPTNPEPANPMPAGAGWHLDPADVDAYRRGRLGPVPAASLEAHLMRCGTCRAAVAATVGATTPDETSFDDATLADRSARWARIADRIDRPERRMVDRRWWLQVTAGSPLLLRSALVLVAALAAVPLLLAVESPRAAVAAFWAVAPVVPLAGAALAYRNEIEPAGALAAATPMASLPLLLVRSLVVLAAAVPVALATALLLPVPFQLLIGWILPGLALPALVLAVGTRVDPTSTAIALATGWTTVVVTSVYRLRDLELDALLRTSFVNGSAFQLATASVAVAAAAVYWIRHDQLTAWSRS